MKRGQQDRGEMKGAGGAEPPAGLGIRRAQWPPARLSREAIEFGNNYLLATPIYSVAPNTDGILRLECVTKKLWGGRGFF